MKKSLQIFIMLGLLLSQPAFACPGGGQIELVRDGQTIAVMNEYEATLEVMPNYELKFLNTKESFKNEGSDFLDNQTAWVWICDERSGIDSAFRSERAFCHDIARDQDNPGVYILDSQYYGIRDFHVSLLKANEPNTVIVFRINGANIDPHQSQTRGLGCGKIVNPI